MAERLLPARCQARVRRRRAGRLITLAALGAAVIATPAEAAGAPRLAPPSKVRVVAASTHTLTLAWAAAPGAATTYKVYRGRVRIASTRAHRHVFRGLRCGRAYRVGVRAFAAHRAVSRRVMRRARTRGCAPTGPSSNPSAPPPAPGQPPDPAKTVVLVDQSFNCTTPVDLDLVRVTMRTNTDDAIHLRGGCTGIIRRVEIETWTADGIKVNPGANGTPRNVLIGGGYIRCHQRYGSIHQDGIQVMGGTGLTFRNLRVHCTTTRNAQLFVQATLGGYPTDVVCESCVLGEGAGFGLRVETSLRSGARDSVICEGNHGTHHFDGIQLAVSAIFDRSTILRRPYAAGSPCLRP